jgi:plasmid stabilization system protein ParE
MLTLVWRAEALDDLEAIMTYISARDLRAARGLRERIESVAERLHRGPFDRPRAGLRMGGGVGKVITLC